MQNWPMKKNDILAVKALTPKKETINFLMKFSKNLQTIKTQERLVFIVSKN